MPAYLLSEPPAPIAMDGESCDACAVALQRQYQQYGEVAGQLRALVEVVERVEAGSQPVRSATVTPEPVPAAAAATAAEGVLVGGSPFVLPGYGD